jgi:hypothetical protein
MHRNVYRHIHVHRIPLHVRDDAYAPFSVRNTQTIQLICCFGKEEYLSRVGLTGYLERRPSGKSVCGRRPRRVLSAPVS